MSGRNTPCSVHWIFHIAEILQETSTWINITQPNRSAQVRAEKNQAFFSLHGRRGSSSFRLRHLRSTATPLPALTDPDYHFLFESPLLVRCALPCCAQILQSIRTRFILIAEDHTQVGCALFTCCLRNNNLCLKSISWENV